MSEVYTEQWWYAKQYKKSLYATFQKEQPRIVQVLETLDLQNLDLPAIDIFMGTGLYIYGPLGSGKTILAAQVFMESLKVAYLTKTFSQRKMLFSSVPKILHHIKTSYDNKEIDTAAIIQNLIEVDVLVLDEFGVSKPSDWLLDMLYLIVGGRYEQMKSTIFTSNYDLNKVAEILGDERITSRISRTCEVIRKKPWGKVP